MKKIKVNENKYDLRFNYFVSTQGIHFRTTKLWWKPFYWLGNRQCIRYGIDRIINLFTLPKEWTLKRKWNYWGGGGRVSWWIRKHITFD